jgi:invasion protein IalB
VGGPKPTLLGQYGEWGAYMADPGGKKVCFAIAKPTAAETTPPNRPRNPVYMFLSTRPADKVANELSIIAGYPLKAGTEASIEVGSTSYALYTQQDGAWIKNATEEAQLIDAMRQGQTAVVKGVSARGTQSTDTYSLKGLTQALERTAQDCK